MAYSNTDQHYRQAPSRMQAYVAIPCILVLVLARFFECFGRARHVAHYKKEDLLVRDLDQCFSYAELAHGSHLRLYEPAEFPQGYVA